MIKALFAGFEPRGIISDENKRLRYIETAYFIGVFLVILGHSHPLTDAWHNTWLKYMNAFIYTFHMHLYFFVAGYLLVHSHSIDKIGYKKWALNKLLKFGVPYLVLTAIAYFPKALLGNTSDVVELGIGYFLRTTFLEPRNGVWGHFWFITAFIPIDLLWGLWRAYAPQKRWVYRTGLIVGFIISLVIAIFPLSTDLFTLYDISEVAIFYACGVLTALLKPLLWDKKYKLWVGIAICSVSTYFLYPFGNYMNYRAKPLTLINIFKGNASAGNLLKDSTLLNFVVSLSLVWVCWCLALLISKINWFTLPQKISKYTFNIFVFAWPAQAALEALFRGTNLHWLVVSLIMFVAGCMVPILIVVIYQKTEFLHCKFFDYLIGVQTPDKKCKGATQI